MSAVAKTRNLFCGMQDLEIAGLRPTRIRRKMTTPPALKGHGFQPCRNALTKEWASAPEGTRVCDKSEIPQRLNRLLKKSLHWKETADSSGLKPLGMTK